MRTHGLGIIAAIACASVGMAGLAPAEDGLRLRPRTPSREPGQPHSGAREIARRQRQEATRAARTGA